MIKLISLELKNFLSHVDTVISFNKFTGLTLIEGVTSDGHYSSNGSGKSTILEGIVYALTGNTLRGVSVNDVVNRNHKKNTCVTLEFQKGEDTYRVRRYRKDDNFGDSLLIYKGEESISKRVNKETQKVLDDILDISYKVLVSTILLGEGLSARFTQLSDPDKKSLIESTLNLNYDLSSVRSMSADKSKSLELSRSNIEGRLSVLKELSSFDVDQAEQSLSEQLSTLSSLKKELSDTETSLSTLRESETSLNQRLSVVSDALRRYETLESELMRLDREASSYLDEINKVHHNPVCPVCHQELSSEDSHTSFEKSYRSKVEAIHTKMIDVRSNLESLPDKSVLHDKHTQISSELKTLGASAEVKLRDISDVSNRYWSCKSAVDDLSKSIETYRSSVSDIESYDDELKALCQKIDMYNYFVKLFSPTGIIVDILSDAVSYINTRLSTYSDVLLEKEYVMDFVKGKISLVDSKGSSYQSLSNGEKRRLDLSIQFALHDYVHMYCGMKVDTLFIDEILDTLDDVGVENIFEVLRMKLNYCGLNSVFVITHNNSLKDKFDEIITVKKDISGDSRILS